MSGFSTETNKVNENVNIEWGDDHVNILVEWADKALCYKWLHSKSHASYASSHAWFTIPVIIMSTVAGTANFAQEKFPENIRQYVSMTIGTINLFSGIISTIQQYLKISELNEAHRVAYIGWDKFYRNTKVELSKSPNERMSVIHIMKYCKEEFDRLMETSPSISDNIVKDFLNTFSTTENKLGIDTNKKYIDFMNIKKPDICDSLESTRTSVFKPSIEMENTMNEANIKNMELQEKYNKINRIIIRFNKKMYRNPIAEEILVELDNKIELDIINHCLSSIHKDNLNTPSDDENEDADADADDDVDRLNSIL